MDETIQKQLTSITEDNIVRGHVDIDVPAEIIASLETDPQIKVFKRVRFTRQTPRKKRLINEAVIARYHKDLQNKELLSNEQLRKINIERGEWSKEKEDRMIALQEQSTTMMRDLYVDGMDHREQWVRELVEHMDTYIDRLNKPGEQYAHVAVAEMKQQIMDIFDRWAAYTPAEQAAYDTKYAATQGRTEYSPDADFQRLIDLYPDVDAINALGEIDELRFKLHRYTELVRVRRELVDLQVHQARIFAESVESRRDSAEELARVFYLTERLDGDMPAGTLTATYDAMWDLPEDVIQWLIVELYFFINGVPEEARRYLAEWGFIQAPHTSGLQPQSEKLPEQPSSSSDTKDVTKTDVSSSELVPDTNLEISS